MATTAKTEITVTATGDGIDSEWTPTPMTNNNGPAGGPVKVTLAAGENTLTVPTGSMGMVIAPRAATLGVTRLRAVTGETGFALRGTQPSHVSLPTGATGVILYSTIVDVIHVHWT